MGAFHSHPAPLQGRFDLGAPHFARGIALLLLAMSQLACHSTSGSNPWQMPAGRAPVALEPRKASPPPLPRGDLPDAKGRLFENGWYSEYADASSMAKKRKLSLLVDFHADWCLPCQYMKQRTFHDPTLLREMQTKVIPLRIDVTEETHANRRELERYQVHALPCVLLLDSSGKTIHRFDRVVSVEELLHHLRKLPEGDVAENEQRPTAAPEQPPLPRAQPPSGSTR